MSVSTTIGWLSGTEIVDCLERAIKSGWRLPPLGRRGIADLLGHDIHQPHPDDLVDPLSAQEQLLFYNDDNQQVQRSRLTFDHHRLDAFHVAREALELGDSIARRLPRGYASLSDQLRRALLSAYLGIAEASSRQGADRMARFRTSRGEASEAAAALEAVTTLRLAPAAEVEPILALLDRLCAMLTRLSGAGLGPSQSSPSR